ncbi:MAG TPA: PAS domain S-box protein [Gemmatimonadales bacterium]|jgi:PAS domain S-box-containing protein|nr:PAS domain S-box protein [Gemmatimonadales bacterium]
MATPQRRKSQPKHAPARGAGRRSEDHFRKLVEGVLDYAILLLDSEGRIATWNAGAERVTGYSAEEILGEPSDRFYTSEALNEGVPARHLESAVQAGRLSEEGWCVRKDGSRFWAGVTITAVVGAEGAPRSFLIIAQDLTLRREMEQQLRQSVEVSRQEAELRLQESEERFARFAQHLPGLAWIKDLEGRYVYINEAGARAFARPRHEIHGLTDAELFPPETAARFRENDRLAVVRKKGIEAVEHLTYPDGSVHHSIVSKFPILDAQGNIQLVGGIAIDITERVRAEEALLLADRRKDEFLATLSHELRNPLAPLRNSLYVLRDRGGDPRTERIYQMMEQQLNRMVRLVDDLLEVSRITGGKIGLRKEPVAISAIVESAVETSRPLIEASAHQLTLNLPAEPLIVDADPVRMAQVVSNLLNNAAKYTPEGGHITLRVTQDDATAVLSIRDNGLGIPAHMLPRVFEMFAQVDRTLKRAQGGLGIGLALARSLVEMHRGRIEAHSGGLNQGSEFVVRIPLTKATPEVPAPAGNPTRQPSAGPLPRVLVVDDSQDGADSLALVLQTLGAETRVAYDGDSALATARAFQPSLVLLDLGMPEMDGYEVAARIRADPALRGVQLIALTGFGSEEERRRSSEAGFDAHCVKPVDPARLQAILTTKVDPPA